MFKSLDKCPICGASQYKNNDLYVGDKPDDRSSIGKNRKKKKGGKRRFKILNHKLTHL
jgi:hypothetical protein